MEDGRSEVGSPNGSSGSISLRFQLPPTSKLFVEDPRSFAIHEVAWDVHLLELHKYKAKSKKSLTKS